MPSMLQVATLAAVGLCLSAQEAEPMDPGVAPTRELFPLQLIPLTYQPLSPKPLGTGRWQVALHSARGNVFEFSDAIKNGPPRDLQGRIQLTRAYWTQHAADYPQLPFAFWFDEEVLRTTLDVRTGLGPRTDAFLQWAWVSHSGGILDSTIERFHAGLGFRQWGRDLVARNQLVVAMMSHGQVTFYSDDPITRKPQDPVLGIVHQLVSGAEGGLSLTASVKPPLTTTYDVYQSGWDTQLGATGWWDFAPGHQLTFGGAYTHRATGSAAYEAIGFRDELAGHLGLRWRTRKRLQPYLQLQVLSGFARRIEGATFHRPAFTHDLGLHWFWSPRAFATFRYVNNISHNENTADMAFAVGVTTRF
ncbi:MAG TPA: DUF3187 family protein [Holophagaceae bacterium]|nr:DUF3187 family protein [Holophagaceae bacterium]